jgi:Xaa-Pro dipeptidase
MDKKITKVQQYLSQEGIDGWLLYDFRKMNDLAYQFLEIKPSTLITRRYFYFIPKQGAPVKVVHGIESNVLDHLPGKVMTYRSWQEWEKAICEIVQGKTIAMEYSPRNALPYISKVDAGTLEVVRGFGAQVVSSGPLLQLFNTISEKQLKSHALAGDILSSIVEKVWEFITLQFKQQKKLSEYDVQQFMLEQFALNNCISHDPPICAINENSANPHYMPTAEKAKTLAPGDFILIDLWCKKKEDGAIYGDITRIATASDEPTERQQQIFTIVREAQREAFEFVKARLKAKKPIYGFEVDQVCRDVITKAGFGPYFIHRTGHNIDEQDHGSGSHIDNYETHDDRPLLPSTCFSIEPGIYLPGEFGVRLEYDVYIDSQGVPHISGGEQDRIACLNV